MYVDVKGQVDQRIRDNRRIAKGKISWKMNVIHLKRWWRNLP